MKLNDRRAFDEIGFLNDDVFAEFALRTSTAPYLFGDDVNRLLKEVRLLADEVEDLTLAMRDGTEAEKVETRKGLRARKQRVRDLIIEIVPKFSPYMKLAEVG